MNLVSAEFRRGRSVLFAAAMGIAFGASPIPFNAIGPFTIPLEREFGWARGDIMFSLFVFTLAVVITVPWIGGLADRIGVRKVALGTLALFGLSFAAIGLTTGSILVFYALWFAMGALGGGSTPVSWTRMVNAWFVHNRGLALALALLGTGVTAIFLPSIATWLIGAVGWRWAFACIALLPLAIALPIAWHWFRDPPESAQYAEIRAVGQAGVEVREALRDYRFWIIAASILMVAIGVGGSITNFQPLLIDRGFDASLAAKIAGLIGLSVILGRLVAGYLIDRFWAPLVTLPMLALPALACFLLAQEQISVPGAMLSASLIGLAAGAETDLVAFLTARYFGLRNYGRLYGLQYAVFGFASGIAPAMFGRVHDLYGTYQPILYAAAVLFVLGAVLLLALGRYPTFDKVASASAT